MQRREPALLSFLPAPRQQVTATWLQGPRRNPTTLAPWQGRSPSVGNPSVGTLPPPAGGISSLQLCCGDTSATNKGREDPACLSPSAEGSSEATKRADHRHMRRARQFLQASMHPRAMENCIRSQAWSLWKEFSKHMDHTASLPTSISSSSLGGCSTAAVRCWCSLGRRKRRRQA